MYLGASNTSEFPPAVVAEIARCEAAGGYAIIGYNAYGADRNPLPSSAYVRGCQMPERAAPQASAGPVSINVPTQITTQVSPQISPVFVQQDQPKDSPVNAATVSQPTQRAPVLAWNDPDTPVSPTPTQPQRPYDDVVSPPAPGEAPQATPMPQPGISPGIIMAGAALLFGLAIVLKGK